MGNELDLALPRFSGGEKKWPKLGLRKKLFSFLTRDSEQVVAAKRKYVAPPPAALRMMDKIKVSEREMVCLSLTEGGQENRLRRLWIFFLPLLPPIGLGHLFKCRKRNGGLLFHQVISFISRFCHWKVSK